MRHDPEWRVLRGCITLESPDEEKAARERGGGGGWGVGYISTDKQLPTKTQYFSEVGI